MNQEDVKYLIVHCSANRVGDRVDVHTIDHDHRARGFRCIGYHYVINRDGSMDRGRGEHEQGAHVKGYNDKSIGICLVGGLDDDGNPEDNFTKKQKATLRQLLAARKMTYPDAELVGHRDLSPDLDGDGIVEKHEWLKQCPCFDVKSWWVGI